MEDLWEFVGHLKAELLTVRECHRMHEINDAEALRRINEIRRRARTGDDGYLRAHPQPSLFQQPGA